MIRHTAISSEELRSKIRQGMIRFGGNSHLHLYGRLDCKSGMRMKKQNRVFFYSEEEAIKNGYRPCGNCMREAYHKWKEAVSL